MKKTQSPKTPRKIQFDQFSDEDLVLLRARLETEMKRRGVAYSIGDIGETLVVKHFTKTSDLPNLQLAPTGTKNVDALSRNGDRYSMKIIRDGRKTGTIYPDDHDPDKQLFEYLVIAKLSDDLSLQAVYEFTWQQFLKARSWDKRMSAWYIGCSVERLAMGRKLL